MGAQVYDVPSALVDVFSFHPDIAFHTASVDQVVHAIQAAKERGFTTAGWSDQRGDRIFFDLHVQIDQRLFLTVKQVQVLYVKNYILHSYLLIPSL